MLQKTWPQNAASKQKLFAGGSPRKVGMAAQSPPPPKRPRGRPARTRWFHFERPACKRGGGQPFSASSGLSPWRSGAAFTVLLTIRPASPSPMVGQLRYARSMVIEGNREETPMPKPVLTLAAAWATFDGLVYDDTVTNA